MIFEERTQEAIRELELLIDRADVSIGVLLSLVTALRRSKKPMTADQAAAIEEYESRMRELRKGGGDLAYYFAGMALFLFDRCDKAREYLSRALKTTTYQKETMNLHGWVDITSSKESLQKKAEKFFDDANEKHGGNNIDSLMGKVKCLEMQNNTTQAIELVSKIIVANNKFVPALMEKMRLQLVSGGWEEAYSTASRCLIINPGCIDAMKYQILKVLCLEGHYEEVSSRISELSQLLDRHEPKNGFQFHRCANLFSRICGRNQFVLQQCVFLAERALQLCPDSVEYNNGMGRILLLQNKSREAIKYFKIALSNDESSLSAIQGIIACQLKEGMIKEASTQLEFLHEVQANLEKTSELRYLTAIIKRMKLESQSEIMKCLDDSIQIHFSFLSNMNLSIDYLYLLNPDFLIEIVQEYMQFCPQQASNANNIILKRSIQILEQVVRCLPGLQQAGFLLAKSYFMSGDLEKSKTLLETTLDADQAFFDGHLLMAQIYLQLGNFKSADHTLEVGVSYNFQVRENPMFHLLKGRIYMSQKKYLESKKSLQYAMQLPGVKITPGKSKAVNEGTLTNPDRLSIYLELAITHRHLGEHHESAKILQDAQRDFSGSEEEARITICNADLAVQRGDIESALTILRSVGVDHSYFVEARKTMAEIYLKYRKDKRLYAACFKELVERQKTPESLILLGDAYMEIQQPDKAIAVYEEACQIRDGDIDLAAKLGLALVKTHNYSEAIKYYRKVVKFGQSALRKDLANLLINLQIYDDAKSVIMKGISEKQKSNNYGDNLELVQLHILMSNVHKHQEEFDKEISELLVALNIQNKILKRVIIESPDGITEEKKLATEICMKIASCYSNKDENESAIKYYKEALVYQESHPEALLELTNLQMKIGDIENCQHGCLALLQLEDRNPLAMRSVDTESNVAYTSSATLMMAELMVQRLDFDTALFHLKKLLTKKPDHFKALALLIDVFRRSGDLENLAAYFKAVEDYNMKATQLAGYHFCKGLHEWYTDNTSEALKSFNVARPDSEWEEQATYNMVEICLNPDKETVGGDVLDQLTGAGNSASQDEVAAADEKLSSTNSGLKTAENILLGMSTPSEKLARHGYLKQMLNIATKQKPNIEKALAYFSEILKSDIENILALYGCAVANMVLKQSSKAKGFLITLSKINWTREFAEEIEKSMILLADIYLQFKNQTQATECLKICIKYNKSCCKAYEYFGLICEKEQQYQEASSHYSNAWIYCNRNNPSIGYKLAFNFLKTQKYIESIDTCLQVLKSYPKYPKIKKEILDKARLSLRV